MNIKKLGIKTVYDKKYAKWLKECYKYAKKSDHPSTHNASLLIKNNKIILKGANRLPPKVKKLKWRLKGENKHIYINHAEPEIIFQAAKKGISTKGLIMVMPWLPCIPCANAIISSGVKKLIIHKQMVARTHIEWQKELKNAVQLLKEAHVKIVAYDGIVGAKAYMHREEWKV